MSPKLCLGAIITIFQSKYTTIFDQPGTKLPMATRFQRWRFFRNQPISNKNCLWWPCLLMDQKEMNNLYRKPYKDASY
jgi:hypothetical protein